MRWSSFERSCAFFRTVVPRMSRTVCTGQIAIVPLPFIPSRAEVHTEVSKFPWSPTTYCRRDVKGVPVTVEAWAFVSIVTITAATTSLLQFTTTTTSFGRPTAG